MKTKTALTRAIDRIEQLRFDNKTVVEEGYNLGINTALFAIRAELDTEREQIKEAYETGNCTVEHTSSNIMSEQYFTDTYETIKK